MAEPTPGLFWKAPWPARLARWALVCGACAVPSFIWGATAGYHPLGMIAGVAVFVVGYTALTGLPLVHRLMQDNRFRRTAYVGFMTRISLTLLFPFGLAIDVFPGIISVGLAELITAETRDPFSTGTSAGFVTTFLATLFQGILVNSLLALYMLIVLGFVWMLVKREIPEGYCLRCGYDLRASPVRCPECGEPVRNDPRTERLTCDA